jgi:hypothetical protein
MAKVTLINARHVTIAQKTLVGDPPEGTIQ